MDVVKTGQKQKEKLLDFMIKLKIILLYFIIILSAHKNLFS